MQVFVFVRMFFLHCRVHNIHTGLESPKNSEKCTAIVRNYFRHCFERGVLKLQPSTIISYLLAFCANAWLWLYQMNLAKVLLFLSTGDNYKCDIFSLKALTIQL